MKQKILLLGTALCGLFIVVNPAVAQGTAFTYQGRLNDGANPANGSYDLTFALFSVNSGAGQVGSTVTNTATAISNGVFTVTLDFGATFPGADRWLEIGARTNGNGAFTTLTPRPKLTPTPYAIFSANAGSAGNVAGSFSGDVNGTQGATVVQSVGGYVAAAVASGASAANAATSVNTPGLIVKRDGTGNFSAGAITATSFSGNGSGLSSVNAATLGGLSSASFWKTAGNAGTAPGAYFVGTTDNQPLELKVNGGRALRLEPTVNDTNHSGIVNVIGGSPANFVSPGVYDATISGGGAGNYFGGPGSNSVTGDLGTVSGGLDNTASLGATVAGGSVNTASGGDSTVSGGYNNTASGPYATIPGGAGCTAAGFISFAAGNRAKANNDGTFVWGDATDVDFASTSSNQFLIRASGGVGIGLNNPAASLHVASATTNTPQVQITQNNSNDSVRLRMNVNSFLGWEMDVASGSSPQLQFWYIGAAGPRMTVDTAGNVVTTGTVNGTSDRNPGIAICAFTKTVTGQPNRLWGISSFGGLVRRFGIKRAKSISIYEEVTSWARGLLGESGHKAELEFATESKWAAQALDAAAMYNEPSEDKRTKSFRKGTDTTISRDDKNNWHGKIELSGVVLKSSPVNM